MTAQQTSEASRYTSLELHSAVVDAAAWRIFRVFEYNVKWNNVMFSYTIIHTNV
ncbi:hypothetical protein [Paenibacillus roseipurpureus]|uniref:Uncharacterized protein n=1 Tax=Paenibacillus roseopurpureus TaxID=2918901 RepID=A0AA96LT33_9BACL|nr:hypothetical protein [Paenibacillus sp. MBLB1832]WNR45448.1 hypothetical protein MJB10_04755 [Paenibacillus sp. MBLB1832]